MPSSKSKRTAAGDYIDAYVSEAPQQSSGNTIKIDASGNQQQSSANQQPQGGNPAQSNIAGYVNATNQNTGNAQKKTIQDQKAAARNVGELTQQVAEETRSFFDWASDWSLGVQTPGGIALILIAIFILIFAIVPVNDQGDTRLYLMWLTLLGQTSLKGGIDDRTAGSKGASGNFGQTSNAPTQIVTQGTQPPPVVHQSNNPATPPIQQQAPSQFLSGFDVNTFGGGFNGL